MKKILEKIEIKKTKVAIIGLGYVGLPLAVEIAKANFKVIGIDKNKSRINKINNYESYISDVSNFELKKVVSKKKLIATQNFKALEEVDVIIICVPTPLTNNKEPDMSYIKKSLEDMTLFLHKEQLIVLESTTYPGTTEELIKPHLEDRGFEIGKDIFLAFSPERVDPGNKKYKTGNIPKIVGGITDNCTEVAKKFYEQVISEKVYSVSSAKVAEMVKLLENIFRNVNIALVNELTMLCDRMNIDVWEVIEAAKTKPYGFTAFYPGPGVGGHCIPVDPFYLSWKAKEYDFRTKFIELAGEINSNMPSFVIEKIRRILNQKRKCLNGANILIFGISYKKDVSDVRESPALKIIEFLQKEQTNIYYYDPYVPVISINFKSYKSIKLVNKKLEKMDVTVIITDHSVIDYKFIAKHSQQILDTRNVYKKMKKFGCRIWKL